MKTFQHKFLEAIPDEIEDGIIYISIKYNTAVHKCACGCENEVITPITPTGWKLTYDGKTVSFHPSIGSWNLACRSHYFIQNNLIKHCPAWSDFYVQSGRTTDTKEKKKIFGRKKKRRK